MRDTMRGFFGRVLHVDLAGWTKEHYMLPLRFFKEPINGKKISKDEFIYMLEEYYQLRGWDGDGKPLRPVRDVGWQK